MAFQPRPYGLVPLPQAADPLRSLSDLMQIGSQAAYAKQAQSEDLYRQRERARVTEDRATLASAQSSSLPPDEIKKQLQQLGRGDLVPIFEDAHNPLQASRLNLQRAKQQAAEADADYFGGYAAAILKTPDADRPAAIKWAVGEIAKDRPDMAETLQQQLGTMDPAALTPHLQRLVEMSPTQRKRREDEAERAQRTTEREAVSEDRRLAITQRRDAEGLRAMDRAEDNALADRRLAADIASRERTAQIAAGRVSADDRLSSSDRARIEREYAEGMNAIDAAMRPTPNRDYPDDRRLDTPGIGRREAEMRRARLKVAYQRSLSTAAPAERSLGQPAVSRGGAHVRMRAPDGGALLVPRSDVDRMTRLGATLER